jgi:Trp operon repressor
MSISVDECQKFISLVRAAEDDSAALQLLQKLLSYQRHNAISTMQQIVKDRISALMAELATAAGESLKHEN